MIVQAKAGTGKTLVFAIVCVDKINPVVGMPQVPPALLNSRTSHLRLIGLFPTVHLMSNAS